LLPITAGCTQEQALGDGEDFELLFAIPPERIAALRNAWETHFPEVPLSEIGHLVSAGQGETLRGGWDHFGSSARVKAPRSDDRE
jgi:thiamine-monophosphate kinase